jgi:hypothetical protein
LLFLILAPVASLAQVTETFNTSGSFTVPAGVTSITVGCWGGGGGGGTRSTSGVAGGGGGGAYSSSVIAVTAGDVFNYVVGNGGTSGPCYCRWRYQFGSATTIMAKGGNSVTLIKLRNRRRCRSGFWNHKNSGVWQKW